MRKEWTVRQAADELGKKRQFIALMIATGRMRARRFGHSWIVTSLKIATAKRGRPRTVKH